VALGRKNYLFAGSDAGGERAAATAQHTRRLSLFIYERILREIPLWRRDDCRNWKESLNRSSGLRPREAFSEQIDVRLSERFSAMLITQ
jgi:hypothetical protein